MNDKEIILKTEKEANKLVKYFNGKLIGSILLKNQINIELIKDIDVAIDKSFYFLVRAYLTDIGFEETKEGYKMKGYQDFIGSCIFKKNGYIPIHLLLYKNDIKVLSVQEIWASKIIRYNESDIEQIQSLISNNPICPWKIKSNKK